MTSTDDKLARLLEILEHQHIDACFREYQEDCGEHHAHNRACLTRRSLTCSISDRYRTVILSRATPALLALVRAAAQMPRTLVTDVDTALDALAATDIRW